MSEATKIPDDVCRQLRELCERKMDVGGIEDREAYMPLLLEDVLKEYLFRNAVNAASIAMMSEREEAHV